MESLVAPVFSSSPPTSAWRRWPAWTRWRRRPL